MGMITKDFIDKFRRFADNEVHPVVSPDNWHIYSRLIDFIDELDESLKEQEQKAVPVDTKMTDKNTVMSWLEGLTQDDWQKWYSDSEVQETAKAALKVMKGLDAKRVLSDRQCEVSPHYYERKGFCPKCHQEVKLILNRNYCGFCGQAVKWNE